MPVLLPGLALHFYAPPLPRSWLSLPPLPALPRSERLGRQPPHVFAADYADGVEDPKFDANVIAYVATGVWHHWLLTGDRGFLESMWPVVERATDFVLDLQTPRGEILWARHPDGTPWSFALLTGSASICHSLRCAVAVAEEMGHERPDWELSLGHLAHVVRTRPAGAFAPKDRWAMDWYYPVLGGAITGDEALTHLASRRNEFVIDSAPGGGGASLGVRCVSDKDWATAAETSECAMAYLLAGDRATAIDLFRATLPMRQSDGRYLTGIVYPDRVTFPDEECSTYTAAAVIKQAGVSMNLTSRRDSSRK